MHDSKLIQYLSLFSKQDIRLFRAFVDSPYYNKHEKTKELLVCILKATSWDSAVLHKKKVFAQLFPSKKFNEQHLRTVMSYLVQLIHQFYVQQHKKEEVGEQKIRLLETALVQDQKKLFELTAGKWEKMCARFPYRDSAFFQQQARYYRQLDTYDLKYGKRISGNYLEQAIHNFDIYYIGEKLRMTCEMLARTQVTGQLYSFSLVDELTTFIQHKSSEFENIPGVWFYYLVYNMMTKNQTDFYFELKERLKQDAALFRHQEARDLYTHALNYCIGRINTGEALFQKETLELYQQMLDKELLYLEGVLPLWDYTNIVSLGCTLQEKAWTKSFIEEQKNYLLKEVRENAYTYNLAAFYYAQQDYSDAITLLQKVEFTDVYYSLLTRILLLKIYFETADWKTLDYFLETFRIYLLRNKQLDTNRRKSSFHLIKYTRNIAQLLEQKDILSNKEFQEKTTTLQKKIAANPMVLNKSWLLAALNGG